MKVTWILVNLRGWHPTLFDKIFAGSDSDFDPEIDHIKANATQNTDSSATSDKSGNVEPRDDMFDNNNGTEFVYSALSPRSA